MFKVKNITRMFVVAVLATAATMQAAQADDDEDVVRRPAVSNAKWVSECGACHVAYPARYLPAESWRAIMAGLDKHFGSNAGLDAADVNEITAFLEKNADARKKSHEASGKPLLRITETRWFKSEHREVAARTWKLPKVKSPANCGACHTRAESGDFSERNVKVPK
jgi:nitrate/TMAO reductase-like tetraheme cytochrome c subunit